MSPWTDFAPPDDQRPICKNVSVSGRRTSVRMEPVMWQSLEEIRQREGLTLNQICTMIDRRRGDAGLTAALRVFIITYFRELLRRTEDGHPTPKEAHQPRGPGQPSDFMRRVLAVFD